MSATVLGSGKVKNKRMNNLPHELDPEMFVELFTKGKCTTEEKQIRDILKAICALRNSGGGRLTIRLTETYLISDVHKSVEIIKDAVNKVLSDTNKTDLLELTSLTKIIFLVRGSKEIVTMKYNMYMMTDGEAKIVPTTKSAAEMRLLLQGSKQQSPAKHEAPQLIESDELADKMGLLKDYKPLLHGGIIEPTVAAKISHHKVPVQGMHPDIHIQRIGLTNVPVDQTFPNEVEVIKGEKIGLSCTSGTVKLKKYNHEKFNSLANRMTKDKQLMPHLTALANDQGGELYYGISEDGTVFGVHLEENEIGEILKMIETKNASVQVWPQRKGEAFRFFETAFLPVRDGDNYSDIHGRYVIKIRVNPCQNKVFVEDPESYKVVNNAVQEISFNQWIWFLQGSLGKTTFVEFKENDNAFDKLFPPSQYQTTLKSLEWVESFKVVGKNDEYDADHLEIVCKFDKVPCNADILKIFGEDVLSFITYKRGSKHEWFETNILDENGDIKLEYADKLKSQKSLEWVENFRVVDKNEECGTRHLEIVCKLGEVPRTADIIEVFGEQILPFLTYQKGSHREWFETNIFDENYDMQQEYEDKLFSLPWVEGYYVGVTTEPEKSWQIYITCAPKVLPSMKDLKKEFGTDISCFVDFVQESDDENSKDSKESLPSSSFLRGPISGDELCVQEGKGGCGAIGILTGGGEKHYATTCYHVCFREDLPEDIKKGHEILKKDCEEQSEGCEGTTYVYTPSNQEETLGTFCCGLYDDNHDIALIELQPTINCTDTVQFLANQSIRSTLANKKEIKEIFYEMAELPVEIIRPTPTRGQLFATTGAKRDARNKRCYRIKRIGETDFAKEGDSGSLVYLVYEGEKIPFAYVCMVIPESEKVIYYCRSMADSIEQLIRKHMLKSDMKPCLGKCGQPTTD